MFWFSFFCCGSQFSSSSKTSYYWEIIGEEAGSICNNPVDGTVVKDIVYILGFGFLI